jgi:hypothetical protein
MKKENRFTLDQVGYLVADLATAARQLEELLGIGPFEVNQWPVAGTQPDSYLDGQPADWRMDIGFADVGSVHLELIQPVAGNPQLEEFLAKAGSGLHHLRFTVEDFDQAVAEFQSKGYSMISCGRGVHAGSRWAYFDTRSILNGLIIELRTRGKGKEETRAEAPWLTRCVPDSGD